MSLLIEISNNNRVLAAGFFPCINTTGETYDLIKYAVVRVDSIKRSYANDMLLQSLKLLQLLGCTLSRQTVGRGLKNKYSGYILSENEGLHQNGAHIIIRKGGIREARSNCMKDKEMLVRLNIADRMVYMRNCFVALRSKDCSKSFKTKAPIKHLIKSPLGILLPLESV